MASYLYPKSAPIGAQLVAWLLFEQVRLAQGVVTTPIARSLSYCNLILRFIESH
ncbi:hypothetical protein SBDP1_490034 [Syntrophobacter sp. SbD1]|nr:hypothetical protein SBDP1_490034 [Syntrophobacter sp. SbD1]